MTTGKSNATIVNEILKHYQEKPSDFDNSPIKEMLVERQNLEDKKRKLAGQINDYNKEIEEKMMAFSKDMLKQQGIIDYVEEKIVEAMPKE